MACALAVAPLSAQESQAKILLPEWTFTTGIEGRRTMPKGNIYACAYKEQGTIGILRDRKADLFAPSAREGSVGNRIVFDALGHMCIAGLRDATSCG